MVCDVCHWHSENGRHMNTSENNRETGDTPCACVTWHRACHGASSHCGGLFSRNLLLAHPRALLSVTIAIPHAIVDERHVEDGGIGSPAFAGIERRVLLQHVDEHGPILARPGLEKRRAFGGHGTLASRP